MTDKPFRTGKRYRPGRLKDNYDAIVIGSGIGGLTTAACLARDGRRVLVLEQHYTAGGMTHTYERHGYEWDVGLHYVGDMNDASTSARRLFDYISDGSLEWAPMDAHFDRIFLGQQQYDLVAGSEAYKAELLRRFPAEQAALDSYFAAMQKVRQGISLLAVEKALPGWAGWLVRQIRHASQGRYFRQTTRQVLESMTDNQTLIAVLCGQWGDCGMPPAESSFVIHSMIARHYMQGASYPVGGSARLADSIIPVIEAAGGDVFTYADVAEILVEQQRAAGVRMVDGTSIRAPLVISNAGAFNTFTRLLPAAQRRPADSRRLAQVQRSPACLCLYIGLQDSAENLGLPKSNLWIYPGEHYEQQIARFEADPSAEIPLVYISFPSAKDPDFARRHPGRATIEIIAPGPFDWFADWQDSQWGQRGDDYLALKAHWSGRLLAVLYQHLPQLQGKVDYHELSTALSNAHFCRYPQGEIYGLQHDPARFEQHWLKPATRIPGLYLTGQDVMSCGIVGAAVGGVLCAAAIDGFKGMKLVKRLLA